MGDPVIEFGTGRQGQSELRLHQGSIRAKGCAGNLQTPWHRVHRVDSSWDGSFNEPSIAGD
jgi:hypothetical protein